MIHAIPAVPNWCVEVHYAEEEDSEVFAIFGWERDDSVDPDGSWHPVMFSLSTPGCAPIRFDTDWPAWNNCTYRIFYDPCIAAA